MTPVEGLHSQRLFSETSTNTSNALSISSLLKACKQECSSTLEEKVIAALTVGNIF